jgi:SAM-dependent methyltransferase
MTAVNPSPLDVLDLREWARPVDHLARGVLVGILGPVLEVGCGPGRFVAALAESGTPALGIDVIPLAFELAAQRGAPVLARSIFDRVPGEGRWPTVLLLDGSIGIGGDPVVLLRRVREVLAPRGRVLVEIEGPGCAPLLGHAQIEREVGAFSSIPWAKLGIDHVHEVAAGAGFSVVRVQRLGGRWFCWLRSASLL